MKISTNSRYALRFLVRLAGENNCRRSVCSIAEQEGISEKMLERIAAKLGKAGLVRSTKGVGGGYELAMPADSITVTKVLELMETPYLPIHCVESSERCVRKFEHCPCVTLWTDIDHAIRSVTDRYTVATIAESITEYDQLFGCK